MMNFRQQIAKYVTGNLTTEQLPDIGVTGLEEGLDTPSLCILAGLSNNESPFQIDHYFKLTLEELNKRRPEVYTTIDCQMCQDGKKETQAHLASCSGQKSLWKRIQKVTTATAWNELKEKDKIRIPPQVLHKVLFGETEAEEITNRRALMKGLIMLKVKK